jgi:signal transduction histidine kinase
MNLLLAIALVSLTLQFATTAVVLTLGSTPRWRRARWFAAVSFTAGCYALVDVLASSILQEGANVWATRANLVNGTLNAIAWLVYSHVGEEGTWQGLPRWVRRWVVGGAVAVVVLAVTGAWVVKPEPSILSVPQFGITYETGELTTFGTLITAVPFTFFFLSIAGYWRRWRAGDPGAGAILIGFALLFAAVLEEIAVSAGWLRFVYLADVGYVCAVAPVTVQMMRRFRDDALQLDRISQQLAEEVDRRTEERDEARTVMVEQQRLAALGRLSAGVGHEINNPLQYLRFNLDELQEHFAPAPGSAAAEALAHAYEGVDRIRQVVQGLRTYARPSEADRALLDVRDLVQAALRVGAPQWRQGIIVETRFGAAPRILGNEGRLVQVILNPLVNGAQAMLQAHADGNMRGHTRLIVATRTTLDGDAEIEILDEGPGFPPAVRARLGEPYVTTRADQGGTGLGLFVSRGIVEAHGGTMHFANRATGGAMVRIMLPAAPASVAATLPASTDADATPPATSAAANTTVANAPREASASHTVTAPHDVADAAVRVLLVEDDPAALRALVRGLQAEGFIAHGAGDAEEALAWLAAEPVDLVITDLMMPGVSGPEFARRLAESHPALRERLVVLTGGASSAEAEAFLDDPSLLVLAKPIRRADLAREIRARLTPV